jgi:transposase
VKPGRGRPRQLYMKQIMLDIKRESYIELKRVAINREEWKNISSFNQSTD